MDLVYQKNLAISQLGAHIAIATLENGILIVDFPIRDGFFLSLGSLPEKIGYLLTIDSHLGGGYLHYPW